jgi:hypothetical protein
MLFAPKHLATMAQISVGVGHEKKEMINSFILITEVTTRITCELIIDQLVGFLVVEPTHLSLSPQFDTGAQDLTAMCFQW